MGGDDRVPDDDDDVHEPKTPRVFSPGRMLTGAAMGGGVCGLGAGAGGAASCAIVFKVFEPKNPMPEGCRILAVHALETRSRGRGAPWDAGAGPTRQGSAKGSPFKRFRKRR